MVREQVLGLVAHDLRNPVHTIVMAAGALIDIPFGPEDRRKQLELISRCAGTMERLIADLLDVHRIDAGTFAVKRERIPVAPITQEVCDRFRDDAATRGVTLAAHVEPELPLILGDRERLVQALSNLVSNAIRFTPHDGRIEIGAKCQGDKLCLTVQDTGAGIAPDKISAVFERFWQGDRTSGGAGLGLAIVKGIVASHDGAIKVESVVGQGTTFSLIFPSAAVR